MELFDFLEKGRCRMLSDTINWALYGDIKDLDLATNTGFNSYYGDLYGSGEETFPLHMAHRSIAYQRENLEVNRPHVEAIRAAGNAYIYYASSCTFDGTYFTPEEIAGFECVFPGDEIAFATPNRLYACFNSEAWLTFQVEKCAMLVNELDFDGIFFDNIFYLNPCGCERCREKYRRLYGKELLEVMAKISIQDTDEKVHNKGLQISTGGLEADRELWLEYMQYADFRLQSLVEFYTAFRERVYAATSKKIAIIANSCLYMAETMEMFRTGIFDCYYTENGYTYAPETNAFSYKVGNAILPEKRRSVVLVTRVLEGMPTPIMMKAGFAEAMANSGCFTPWGFFVHESATLKAEITPYVQFAKRHEALLAEQESLAEIAVVVPTKTYILKKLLGDEAQYLNTGAQLASRILGDFNHPYHILFADDALTAERLARYRLLVYPEADIVSNRHFALLQQYAAGGGAVLATGDSFALDEDLLPRAEVLQGENVVLVQQAFDRAYCDRRLTASYEKMLEDDMARLLLACCPAPFMQTSAAPLTCLTPAALGEKLVVHLVNYNCNRGPYSIRGIPDEDIQLALDWDRPIHKATLLTPDGDGQDKSLPFAQQGGRVTLTVPRLECYAVLVLE